MKKIWTLVAAAAAVVALGCGTPTPDHAPPAPTVEVTEATPTGPKVSVEQENAVQTAKAYLNGQAFSRKTLIGQLGYEGYPKKVATAAVDSLDADWNAEAEQAAKAYLDTQAFSKKGLTEQLEYDGFTHAQAVYGVRQAGL